MPADLDLIRDRLAEYEREQAARAAAPRPKARGRPQTAATRKLLAQVAYRRHRAQALSDPATHPLRRARLTFGREGLTIAALSHRSLVGESVIQRLETNGRASRRTWERLSRALGVSLGSLR